MIRRLVSLTLLGLRTSIGAQATHLVAPPIPEVHDYGHICPLPKCDTCPGVESLRAPGVGFALDIDHGTAAVRLHDGTFNHVAIIEGDYPYTSLMRRLVIGPINRTPDHFDTYWEKVQYLKARAQRLSNKFVGRPATPETAILASMVTKLLEATQAYSGQQKAIVAAVLSSPEHIQLSSEEIGDVFDYLKLQNLMENSLLPTYELYATSAAYAGYGKGLCRNYIDESACQREEVQLPTQRVLHLDYNFESLSGTVKTLQRANDGRPDASFVDLDLGFGRILGNQDNDKPDQYWTAVSHRIRNLANTVQKYAYLPYITELLLTGPSAGNRRFQAAIRAALYDLVADEDILYFVDAAHDDPEGGNPLFSFATARGAAEIAKRRQEGPVSCTQRDDCRRRRQRVHDEGEIFLLEQHPDL